MKDEQSRVKTARVQMQNLIFELSRLEDLVADLCGAPLTRGKGLPEYKKDVPFAVFWGALPVDLGTLARHVRAVEGKLRSMFVTESPIVGISTGEQVKKEPQAMGEKQAKSCVEVAVSI